MTHGPSPMTAWFLRSVFCDAVDLMLCGKRKLTLAIHDFAGSTRLLKLEWRPRKEKSNV